MHTLHTRAAHIFGWFGTPTTPGGSGGSFERKPDPHHGPQHARGHGSGQGQGQGQGHGQGHGQGQEEGGEGKQEEDPVDSLWEAGWCPLLQGIARLCCDNRKQVRLDVL